jgi:hypothetical protein
MLGRNDSSAVACRLERATKHLEGFGAAPNEAKNTRSLATVDLRDAVSNARQIIAAIDSLIVAEFWGDPSFVAEWRNAKRIGGRIGRPPVRKKSASRVRSA